MTNLHFASDSEAIRHPEKNPDSTRSKKTLTAIIVVSVMPIVLAYTMFFSGVGVPKDTVNYGDLISATSMKKLLSESDFKYFSETNKRWRLLLPIAHDCREACEKSLYTTRQVHIRLGEKSARLERVALNIGGAFDGGAIKTLAKEHPKLKVIDLNSGIWEQWHASLVESTHAVKSEKMGESSEDYHYYMVDQEGNVMMRYSQAHHGNELLKDIKRALKYSIDYQ